MEFYGQVIEVMPQRSGQSANGNWVSQDYVVQSKQDNYGRTDYLCFSVFGQERINRFQIRQGQWVTVYAAVSSQKSQKTGGWFTQARAYDVRLDAANGAAPGMPVYQQQPNTAGQQMQQPMQQPYTAAGQQMGANAQQPNVAAQQQAPFGAQQQPLPFG